MLYHLYNHTLYERLGNSDTINILLSGFDDTYGQKFLDACLQVGQMPNKKLNVNVICSEEEEKQYLDNRPEFMNFFNINDKESYGTINFIRDTNKINLTPCYIFAEDLETAQEFRETCQHCSINFVQLSHKPDEHQDFGDLNPIYVGEDINDLELERMPLNAHLVYAEGWGQSIDIEEFKKPYNHDSSFSYVISLKYKLFSLGINLEQTTYMDAASNFSKKIDEYRTQLIYCEHKRWVVEKICDGWRKKDIETCVSRKTAKDDDEKTHICIVKSSTEHKITSFLTDSIKAWDKPDPAKLRQLDDLDKMSVEFHKHLLGRVRVTDKEKVISIPSDIREILKNYSEIAVAFEELYSCMQDILNASNAEAAQTVRDKVYMYEKILSKNFESKLGSMVDGQDKDIAIQYANDLERAFFTILESRTYTDYKQKDIVLIENIPFILTYRTNINLVVPFFSDINDSTKFFNNIASALVINPERIIYVCKSGEMSEDAFRKLFQFAKRKGLRAEIELKIIGREQQFNLLDIGINNIEYFDSINAIREYISTLKGGKTVIDRNGATIFRENTDGGFNFNSLSMKFEHTRGFSSVLNYIKKRPFINTLDVVYFDLTGTIEIDSPEFFQDYQELWKLYKDNHYAWKMMANALSNYVDRENIIASIPIPDRRNEKIEREYILPLDCRKVAQKIIDVLRSTGIIADGSNIDVYNNTSCRVTIQDIGDHRDYFDEIFSEHERLKSVDALDIYKPTNQNNVKIKYNSLKITDCNLMQNLDNPETINDIHGLINDIKRILNALRGMGYILRCSVSDDGNINLTFATPQIKDLLTKAGKILEVYVYHEAKKSAKFDDVTSGFTLKHGGEQKKNEIDCVITKGFNTLLIECKACYELEDDWYKKFAKLTEYIGINTRKIFIVDLRGHENSEKNRERIEYGKTLGIDTIYKPDQIENIVDTLLNKLGISQK